MSYISDMYNQLVKFSSDINEHLPTLKKYASECDHITEMGVRWVVSTFALLEGNPKTLISIDILDPRTNIEWNSKFNSKERLETIISSCNNSNINYKFILGDTRALEIEKTDLLFIDTLHDYEQLKCELKLHADKVKKYIIFHDTVSFRNKNESGTVGEKNGLYPAIEEFLSENAHWVVHEVFTNCNGLTVLKRT
jgi:hypothetical protein